MRGLSRPNFEQYLQICNKKRTEFLSWFDTVLPAKFLQENDNFIFSLPTGVGGLVINSKNQILVIQELYSTSPRRWKLPGGAVDKGEIEGLLSFGRINIYNVAIVNEMWLVPFSSNFDFISLQSHWNKSYIDLCSW